MKPRFFMLFAFLLFILACCAGQVTHSKLKDKRYWRDSLMAVSILNLDSDFVFVQGGTFKMGLPDSSDVEGGEIEKPQHQVTLKSFFILKTPVTQALWFSIMDSNPAMHKDCYTCPVENISWYDIQLFLSRLNKLTNGRYRLPTEAEYEYAAGGGRKSHGYKYSGSNNEDEVCWFNDNSGGKSHEVGLKKRNELGLADMSGDIWEWCLDWFEPYKTYATDNPAGPVKGEEKVLRGGSFLSLDEGCMVISRAQLKPVFKNKYTGFRLVREQ